MANFSVAARTLFHLGAELITTDEVALYELIKNSFDALSPRVAVRFVAPISYSAIEDALKLLKSNKYEVDAAISKATHLLKEEVRSELSEAVEKSASDDLALLANAEDIDSAISFIEGINYIEVRDTGVGMSGELVSEVFLRIGTDFKLGANKPKKGQRPTLGNKGIGRLSMMRLGGNARVITWTKNSEKEHEINFNWHDFEDPKKLMSDIDFPVVSRKKKREGSGMIIKISALKSGWDLDVIVNGLINKSLRRFQNPFKNNQSIFPVDISYNGHRRIPIKPLDPQLSTLVDRVLTLDFSPKNTLKKEDGILTIAIEVPGEGGFIDRQERTVRDVGEQLNTDLPALNRIGPFKLTVHWYNRAKLAKKGLGKDLVPLRKELDVWNGGIAIYRDGFRIGLTGSDHDGDWLDIDRKALSGRGFTVNRIQTIGVLEISKSKNPGLIDRSNREGFVESQEANLLRELLTVYALDQLKNQIQSEDALEKKERESEIIDQGTGSIEEHLKSAEQNIGTIKTEGSPKLAPHIKKLSENLQFVSNHVSKFSQAITELQETREDILELAGVGTVMTSLLHELERTTKQTKVLLGDISKTSDDETKKLLNKLEDEIKAINVRLSQLDPLSPSGRQRKSTFNIVALTKTILDGYRARFERHDIKFTFTVDDEESDQVVKVKMVKGFYSLALENILTNTIYWLKKGPIKAGEKNARVIANIDSIAKTVTFSDTGPGISVGDKVRIFNPGFSLRHKGNGFGLYIAKEVANHHGADIYLDNDADEDGRLRTFVLELPKD